MIEELMCVSHATTQFVLATPLCLQVFYLCFKDIIRDTGKRGWGTAKAQRDLD